MVNYHYVIIFFNFVGMVLILKMLRNVRLKLKLGVDSYFQKNLRVSLKWGYVALAFMMIAIVLSGYKLITTG